VVIPFVSVVGTVGVSKGNLRVLIVKRQFKVLHQIMVLKMLLIYKELEKEGVAKKGAAKKVAENKDIILKIISDLSI
jgi:hypothetical protein